MEVGPGPLGFTAFAAMKLAGYYGYAAVLNQDKAVIRSACEVPPAWKGGLGRTGIGLLVGVVFGYAFFNSFQAPNSCSLMAERCFLAR